MKNITVIKLLLPFKSFLIRKKLEEKIFLKINNILNLFSQIERQILKF